MIALADAVKRSARDIEIGFVKYERYWYMKKQPKLSLHFTVMETGSDFGKPIQAHYRLDRIDVRGRTYAKSKSRIVRDLGRLFPDYVDAVPLPLSRLKGCAVIGRTRWVTKDSKDVALAVQQQYEIVDCLLGRTNG